jgi:hypothetical protein
MLSKYEYSAVRRSDLETFEKIMAKRKNNTKSYETFTWERSTTFAHDGLSFYHYNMMATM